MQVFHVARGVRPQNETAKLLHFQNILEKLKRKKEIAMIKYSFRKLTLNTLYENFVYIIYSHKKTTKSAKFATVVYKGHF